MQKVIKQILKKIIHRSRETGKGMIGFLWVVSLGFTARFPNQNPFLYKKHINITDWKDFLLHLDFLSQKRWNGYTVLIHFTEQEAYTMECDYIANMLENDFMNLKFSITLQNDRQRGKCRNKFPWEHLKINMKSIFSVICILSLRSNEARYLFEPDERYSRKLIKTVYMFLYIVRHQTSKPKQLLLFECGKPCISFFSVFFFHVPSCPLIGFLASSICLNIGILWSVFLVVFISLIFS